MNDKKTISRRGFLGAIAAFGSIGVAACGTQATNRASVACTGSKFGKVAWTR